VHIETYEVQYQCTYASSTIAKIAPARQHCIISTAAALSHAAGVPAADLHTLTLLLLLLLLLLPPYTTAAAAAADNANDDQVPCRQADLQCSSARWQPQDGAVAVQSSP
jgi:hypothetical protein